MKRDTNLEYHRHHQHHLRHRHHHVPCFHCYPHSYIRMVQHLIERCLLLRMTRDDCAMALAERASIPPIVTLTVWRGLLKENKGFFQAYYQYATPRPFTYRSHQSVSKIGRRINWRRTRQE